MTDYKFAAVLNKKIEPGKAMNALAHMTVWLVGKYENIDELAVIDYADKDGGSHIASQHPFIILKAKNSNQLRTLRENCLDQWVAFASFTEAMTVWWWEEQVARSAELAEAEMEYYGVCLFGKRSVVDPLIKKYSLWL